MRLDDPKAMLVLWCRLRGLPPPASVAVPAPEGGFEVAGSVTLSPECYVRARHRAARQNEAELEVWRDLFVQVQAVAGPIALEGSVPRRRETLSERMARREAVRRAEAERAAAEVTAQAATPAGRARTARAALDHEARRRGAFVCVTARVRSADDSSRKVSSKSDVPKPSPARSRRPQALE